MWCCFAAPYNHPGIRMISPNFSCSDHFPIGVCSKIPSSPTSSLLSRWSLPGGYFTLCIVLVLKPWLHMNPTCAPEKIVKKKLPCCEHTRLRLHTKASETKRIFAAPTFWADAAPTEIPGFFPFGWFGRSSRLSLDIQIIHLEDHPRTCKQLGSQPFIATMDFGHWGRGPTNPVGDEKLNKVINRLLTGMILQVVANAKTKSTKRSSSSQSHFRNNHSIVSQP